MKRREALTTAGLLIGGSILGVENLLTSCKSRERKSIFGILDKREINIVEEFAETILPKTNSSPGAKDVKVAEYINTIITDCLTEEHQKVIRDGIINLDELARQQYDEEFTDLKSGQKTDILLMLEETSAEHYKNLNPEDPPHYYPILKQLTIRGYVTSELVGTTVLRHVPIPGRYEGCISYQPGEKSFTTF